MNKLRRLYKEYPFRSVKKFVPIAVEHGFTRSDAIKFLDTIPHDIKYTNQCDMMLPIYGHRTGCYQMDQKMLVEQLNSNILISKCYNFPKEFTIDEYEEMIKARTEAEFRPVEIPDTLKNENEDKKQQYVLAYKNDLQSELRQLKQDYQLTLQHN